MGKPWPPQRAPCLRDAIFEGRGTSMSDPALQRKNMVESQVRPSNVTDRRIMAAMSAVGREHFVPAAYQTLAYMDTDIALTDERGLMAPRTFAKLVQLAAIADGARVLDVASALGYSAAVLSHLASSVVAVDSDSRMVHDAKKSLAASGVTNVTMVESALADGHGAGAPYDAIIVEGCIPSEPKLLIAQLADGGRLVAVMADGGVGRAVCFEKVDGLVTRSVAFEATAPLLPGFEVAQPAFTF